LLLTWQFSGKLAFSRQLAFLMPAWMGPDAQDIRRAQAAVLPALDPIAEVRRESWPRRSLGC
jgi:hypothetical protein